MYPGPSAHLKMEALLSERNSRSMSPAKEGASVESLGPQCQQRLQDPARRRRSCCSPSRRSVKPTSLSSMKAPSRGGTNLNSFWPWHASELFFASNGATVDEQERPAAQVQTEVIVKHVCFGDLHTLLSDPIQPNRCATSSPP